MSIIVYPRCTKFLEIEGSLSHTYNIGTKTQYPINKNLFPSLGCKKIAGHVNLMFLFFFFVIFFTTYLIFFCVETETQPNSMIASILLKVGRLWLIDVYAQLTFNQYFFYHQSFIYLMSSTRNVQFVGPMTTKRSLLVKYFPSNQQVRDSSHLQY